MVLPHPQHRNSCHSRLTYISVLHIQKWKVSKQCCGDLQYCIAGNCNKIKTSLEGIPKN